METVFTYGSLMFPPVWQHVVLGTYVSADATGIDLARFAVRDAPYPGCVIAPGSNTAGRVYFNVSGADCSRLDTFEGAHYRRDRIVVRLASGDVVPAWTYVYLLTEQLSTNAWSPVHFEKELMHHFLATYSPTQNPR